MNSDIFTEKITEIERKIKIRKDQEKEYSHESTNVNSFDTKISLHTSLLNQEILTKQYQLMLEKHNIEVKSLQEKISQLHKEIADVKVKRNNESEEIIIKLTNDILLVNENLKSREAKYLERESEYESLRKQVVDRDRIIALLEEKISSLDNSLIQYKDKEFEYNSLKHHLEKEKKRREIAENEYKSLVDEVKDINQRSCEQISKEYEEEIRKYQEKLKQYELEIYKNDMRNREVHFSNEKSEVVARYKAIEDENNEQRKIISSLENKYRETANDLSI